MQTLWLGVVFDNETCCFSPTRYMTTSDKRMRLPDGPSLCENLWDAVKASLEEAKNALHGGLSAVSNMPTCLVTVPESSRKVTLPGDEWKHIGSIRERSYGAPALVLFSQLPKLHCADLTAEGYRNIRKLLALSHCPDAYAPEFSGHQEVQDFVHRPCGVPREKRGLKRAGHEWR